MQNLSKLQIRAKVLSVISDIKSFKSYDVNTLKKLIEDLSDISDKQTLFDIFIKEYIKMSEQEYMFSACILKEIIDVEYINEKVFEFLKNSALSDDAKYKLVQLLRVVGGNCNYNEIPAYFENPEEVLDMETKKLLENAVFNPEAMLDFLDFISAVPLRDRLILLESLSNDYKGDMLANIIYPILYSDFDDEFKKDVINVLSESKSSLAIAPFEYIISVSSDETLINMCKVGLKKLKLAGASLDKADEYFKNVIKDTKPAKFFTTIPDGKGNQAILISRENNENKYLLSAVVINDIIGVIDCFGFYNISEDEILKIVKRFYQSDGKYNVPAEYVKTRIQNAIDLTVKNKRYFPYEFLCWYPLLSDINTQVDIKEYVDSNCSVKNISKDNILDVLTKEYTFRWFICPEDNEGIKNIVDIFYKSEVFDTEFINQTIKNYTDIIFSEDVTSSWNGKLYNLIYLLKSSKLDKDADLFFALLKNEEYFATFKTIIIQRSIFNNFVLIKENNKTSMLPVNIFKKKSVKENSYNMARIDMMLSVMSKSWIDE